MRLILLYLLVAMSPASLLAQTSPIKMGLWEKKMVTTGRTEAPDTLTARECITPTVWEQMLANSTKQHPGCTTSNSRNAHGYTFSGTCSTTHVNSSFQGAITIQDSEHIISDMHTSMSINGQTRVSDSHSTSRYVGPDCGGIRPGDPKVD